MIEEISLQENKTKQKMNQEQFKSIMTCGGLFDLLTYFALGTFSSGWKEQLQDGLSSYISVFKKNRKEGRLKADTKSHGIANSLGKKKLLFIGKEKKCSLKNSFTYFEVITALEN